MEYQYKVINFEVQITTKDVRDGVAGKKVCAQLELLLQQYSREGWELQGQYKFSVEVKAGCFDFILKLLGRETGEGGFDIYQLVFRKSM